MTIRLLDDGDVALRDKVELYDPFIHSEPCWRTRIFHLLPPVFIDTSYIKERINRMPIRVVAESEAPVRVIKMGTISSKQDYIDVQNALRTPGATGKAIIVDMDAKAWEGVKKPETAFANNLRRLFDSKGVPLTAYRSGPMQITVRKATALDKQPARGGRSKK